MKDVARSRWETKPLGEVCKFIGGGTPSKHNPAFWGGNFPWVSPKDMKSEIVSDSIDHVTESAIDQSAAKRIPEGSLLIVVRSGILARRIPIAIAGRELTVNQDLKAMVPDKGLDRHFLAYFLRSAERQLLDRVTRGATVHKLDMPVIKSLPIPLPPLEEQQRIVAVLDDAFEGLTRARAHAKANLQNARELFASALGALFERDETASLQTVGALVDAGILEKPLDGNHGETHPKKADFVKVGVPFIMASDLKDGQVDQVGCHHITREQADSLRKGFAKNGDVLLSHKGTIGRTAILETDLDYVMLTPQVTYYRSTDQNKLSRAYLYFAFQSGPFQKQITEEAGGGATRAYIGITKQLELKLPVPAIENQTCLSKSARKIEASTKKAMADYEAKLNDLDDLRQSLLQKAFAGELT